MKIAIFANGKAAIPSINFLRDKQYDILVIVDPDDNGEDSWQPSLKSYCSKNKISFLSPSSFRNNDFLEKLSAFMPSIIFSIQCRKIIKKEIIDMVKGEIFNFHFADLPKNRGCYPGLWHLLNDEYIGVTLHKLTEGIDDGPIIDKIKKKITLADTGRSVYEWCCEQVLPLLKRNLTNLVEKSYKAVKQSDTFSNYYSRYSLDFSNLFIDWNQDGKKIAKYIQTFIFPPFQFPKTRYAAQEMTVVGVIKITKKKRKAFPGKIISIKKNGIEVAVKNGSITICIAESGQKVSKGGYFYL